MANANTDRRTARLFALMGVTSAMAACTAAIAPVATEPNCPAGQVQVGDMCVNDSDAAGVDSSAPAVDGSSTDSDTHGDANDEDGSSPSDAGASNDANSDPDAMPDPCPSPLMSYMVCDSACPGPSNSSSQCAQAMCGASVPISTPPPADFATFVRTPNAPGVDPNCAQECPSGGWVYGLGFQVNPIPDAYTVKVGPPWEIFVASTMAPFCPMPNFAPVSCMTIPSYSSGAIFVMTKDPNAPARNIEFDFANRLTCP